MLRFSRRWWLRRSPLRWPTEEWRPAMFFGYYVAWRNPELQRYYGGQELATFWAAWKHNWTSSPWIFALAAFRALIYVVCLYPLIRMLDTSRRESALAAALFSTCWTTVLLL